MRALRFAGRVIIWTLAAVVVVSAAGAVTVETAWFKQWLSGYIVRATNERLNATLSIGRLTGNLFSGIEVSDVVVTMNGHPVISIETIRASYSVPEIIRRGVVVEHVDVTRPVVSMQRDDDGWELGRFIKAKADEAQREARRPIEIRQLAIAGGTFSMVRPGQKPVRLEPIDGRLTFEYETGHYTFDIEQLSFVSTDPDIPVRQLKGIVEFREDDLRFGNLSIRTAESALSVNGEVKAYRRAPVFALHASADPLSLPEVQKIVPAIGSTGLRPAMNVTLNGSLDRLSTDFAMRSPAGNVSGRGIVGAGEAGRSFKGQVVVRHVDLAPILDSPAQRSDIVADLTLDVLADPLRGEFTVVAPRIQSHDYLVEHVNARARISDRTIRILAARMRAFGADASAAGTVTVPDGPNGETRFDLRGNVSGADLARLPPSMHVPPAGTRLTTAYHVMGVVPRGRPGTQVSGDTTLEPSEVAGATIGNGSTVSFRVGSGAGNLEYSVNADVAGLDLERIGNEFHLTPLARPRYRSAISGHVSAMVRGTALETIDLDAHGTLRESSMFAGTFPEMTFETSIKGDALRVKTNGRVANVDAGIAADNPALKGAVTGTVETDITFAGISHGVRVDSVTGNGSAELGATSVGSVSIDRASVTLDYHSGFADVQQLEVAGSDVIATGHGTLAFTDSGQSGFWIHAEAAHLERLGEAAKRPVTGIATVDAVVGGNRREFVANGNLTANGVKYREYGALTLASTFSAKMPQLEWRQVSVKAESRATFVEIPGLDVNELTAKTEYTDRKVAFDLTASQPRRTVAAAGSLEFRPEDQEVRLKSLRFDTQGLTWQTRAGHEPVITYGEAAIGVEDFQLANGDQVISADGTLGKSGEKLNLALQNVDLGIVDAWLLRMPRLTGRVNATAAATGSRSAPEITADFRVDAGKFRDVTFQSLAGKLDYSSRGAEVDVRLEQSADQWLTAKGHVPAAAFTARKTSTDHYNLHVDSSTIDLGLVQGLTSAISGVKGALQATVDLTGTPDEPRVAGAVTVKGGAFKLEDSGVSYTGLDGRIDLLPDRIHIDDLHVLDNQSQQLSLNGDLSVAGLHVGDVNLYVSATDFKVIDNELGNVRVNSNLRVAGTLARPRIEGELDVSTGSINLDPILARLDNSLYRTTVDVAADAGADSPAGWRSLDLSVHVIIPDDLVVKAKDLKASEGALGLGLGAVNLTLGGDLNVSAAAGKPVTLVGAVNTVRGFYDFQGRRFSILRDGNIRFEGDAVNDLDPALNIAAERVIQAVTARVNVRGRLKRPTIDLTSTPPLEQSDILALIVFNQPLNELGVGQQVSLAQRAGAMAAGAVTSELTNSIAESLRLDQFEINVAPNTGVAAELVVGQQLSRNLYVKLEQGIGERSQTNVILEYEFAKWLRLQTNVLEGASTQQQLFQRVQSTGVDLVFSFSFK